MAIEWGGPKDKVFTPARMILFCPILIPHDEKNFLALSLLLGALRKPTLPRKTLLFVNFPHNYYNFFLIKHVSLVKIYLKLQLNLPHQIKLTFSKNYKNIIEVFNKYHQKKKKFIV